MIIGIATIFQKQSLMWIFPKRYKLLFFKIITLFINPYFSSTFRKNIANNRTVSKRNFTRTNCIFPTVEFFTTFVTNKHIFFFCDFHFFTYLCNKGI